MQSWHRTGIVVRVAGKPPADDLTKLALMESRNDKGLIGILYVNE